MAGRSHGDTVNRCRIKRISDASEALDMLEELGVDDSGLESLSEMQARLLLHVNVQEGKARTKVQASKLLGVIVDKDSVARKELRSIYETVKQQFHEMDSSVFETLKQEGLVADFDRKIQLLETGDCPILVAGETSSGKSSLLNLLMGKKVLPEAHLSCTSAICRLKYAPLGDEKAIIHRTDGDPIIIPIKDNAIPAEILSPYLFKKSERETEPEFKEVDLFLHLDMLKSGIYIIDTPGFGENLTMEKLLYDYIAKTEIFAFIYVIKSDNAGGVQEDRLQKLLNQLKSSQENDVHKQFDPRTAVFVCNRWDLVGKDDRQLVFDDTVKKIEEFWPQIEAKDQVFPMATNKAWDTWNAGYVADDFEKLLDGIKNLIPIGLERKIRLLFSWIERVVLRCREIAEAHLAAVAMSFNSLKERQKSVEKRLRKLKKHSDEIISKAQSILQEKILKTTQSLVKYLEGKEAFDKMSNWSVNDVPSVDDKKGDSWALIESRIETKISSRLSSVIREWEKKHKCFQMTQHDLFTYFTKEFQIIEDEFKDIKENLQYPERIELETDKSDAGLEEFDFKNLVDCDKDDFPLFDLTTGEKIVLGIFSPVIVPVGLLAALLAAPFILPWLPLKKFRMNQVSKQALKRYNENKIKFMREKSQSVLKAFTDESNVQRYVEMHMGSAQQYIKQFEETIPNLVESTQNLMEAISEQSQNKEKVKKTYGPLLKHFKLLEDKLFAFYITHMMSFDYHGDDIKRDRPKSIFGKALWTNMYTAFLQKGVKDQPTGFRQGKSRGIAVTVKQYMSKSKEWSDEYKELKKLSHGRNPFLPRVLGLYSTPHGDPSLVFSEHHISMRESIGHKLPEHTSDLRTRHTRPQGSAMLKEAAKGLDFLHKRGLVHMEFSLDTVMVNQSTSVVKLSNIGLPRCASLPEPEEPIHQYVYLAPEVLNGQPYTTKADVYGLGLAMWELEHSKLAYSQQSRMTSTSEFIANRSQIPYSEAETPLSVRKPFSFAKIYELQRRCVKDNPSERPRICEWIEEVIRLNY